jgi:hypothetical protein
MKQVFVWSVVVAMLGCGSSPSGAEDAGPVDASVEGEPLRVRWELLGDGGPPERTDAYVGTLNGKLVVFGGRRAFGFLDDTWIWDGAWTQVSPETSPRRRAEGVMIEQDGRLVLVGGVGYGASDQLEVLGETWVFDGATWSQLPGTIPPRQGVTGALVDGHVVVVGGTGGGVAERSDAWSLAPGATTWTELPDEPLGRRNAAMATLGDAGYLIGGAAPGASKDITRFDGTEWTTVGELPRARRAYHGAGALADRVVVFGGVVTSTNPIGVTDGWPYGVEVIGDEPAPRMGPHMVTLGDAVLMWGGKTASGASTELWRLTRAP